MHCAFFLRAQVTEVSYHDETGLYWSFLSDTPCLGGLFLCVTEWWTRGQKWIAVRARVSNSHSQALKWVEIVIYMVQPC
jgi:hypothetical protein